MKTINTATICLLLLVSSCRDDLGSPGFHTVIPDSSRATAAKWVQQTVAAANPQSDEEPEDNIAQAERTATRLFGVTKLGIWHEYSVGKRPQFIPYDDATDRQKSKIKKWAGQDLNRKQSVEKAKMRQTRTDSILAGFDSLQFYFDFETNRIFGEK